MKATSKILTMMMFIMMTVFSIGASAQNNTKQRMSREQLAETQANYIANQIAMDDATAAKFKATYSAYQKELWAIGPRLKAQRKGGNYDTQAEQNISERFRRSQQILDLREKYYKKYSQFLTQKQIERVYQLERQMMQRLGKRAQRGQRPQRGKFQQQ